MMFLPLRALSEGSSRMRVFRPAALRRWTLWTLPRSARLTLLGAEALVLCLTVWALLGETLTTTVALRLGILLALSVGYAEICVGSERIRHYLGAGQQSIWPDVMGVWSFAAVLALPVGYAAAFAAAQYAHVLLRRHRDRSAAPFRAVYSGAAVMAGQLAAGMVLQAAAASTGQIVASLVVVVAILIFNAVDYGVLFAGMWITVRPPSARQVLPDRDAVGYELATLVLGAVGGVLLMHSPALLPALVIPLVYLHRSSAIKALHEASRTDAKTGLLNNAAWTDDARAALSRCERSRTPVSLLLIDVDNFKSINDTFGHLAGDEVLTAVAATLRTELRGHDGVGRFGGDEFVVLLEGLPPAEARTVADRIRAVVEALDVSGVTPRVSIGLAHTEPGAPDVTVEQLLGAADTALYVAKAAGRNQLAVAPALVR